MKADGEEEVNMAELQAPLYPDLKAAFLLCCTALLSFFCNAKVSASQN